MATEETASPGPVRPDFLRAGIRCALEMVLAGGLVLLVGLPAENTVFSGLVYVLAVVVMVVVLFWALNRHIAAWIRFVQQGGTVEE
ncbi:hypothetical protein BRD08_01365 [Halobacteriales archaeon SW_10_66_29]|nr:MAG: hypothetical protein BRD08_01365 [Halobacteriales archaeon SW_10_66_29]